MATNEVLNKRVVARWGPGGERGRGICVGYSNQPTLIIALDSGEQIHWVGSLCEVVSEEEQSDAR